MEERHLLQRFKRIHDYVEKNGNNALKESGLTLAQGHIIDYLMHCEEHQAPYKDLEKIMNVAQSTTAGFINRLEHGGFVTTFNDTNDKRIKIVSLTPKSTELTVEIHKHIFKMGDDILSPLTEDERTQLEKSLEKITNNL